MSHFPQRNRSFHACLPFLACLLAGCGELAAVEGTIFLDNEPLGGAAITFASADSKTRSASALSGPDGRYVLTSKKLGDGILPGDYRVIVTKTDFVPRPGSQKSEKGESRPPSPAVMQAHAEKTRRNPRTSSIPAPYKELRTTPITVTVPPQGNKNLEIRLSHSAAK